MDKATPRPWGISKRKVPCEKQTEGDRLIFSRKTKEHVSETFQYRNDEHTDAETSIANADLIVKAVNRDHLFNPLVDALEKAVDQLRVECAPGEYEELDEIEQVLMEAKVKK